MISRFFLVPQRTFGGDKRDRTADLLNAIFINDLAFNGF